MAADSSWDNRFGFPGVNGAVYAITPYLGEIYVGGRFSVAGHEVVHNLARWDGTNWHAVGVGAEEGVDSTVIVLSVIGGKLWVGGAFHTAGSQPSNLVAEWDGSSWTRHTQLTSDHGPNVHAFAQVGSNIYAAGYHLRLQDSSYSAICQFDGTSWSEFRKQQGTECDISSINDTIYFTQGNGIRTWILRTVQGHDQLVGDSSSLIEHATYNASRILARPGGVFIVGDIAIYWVTENEVRLLDDIGQIEKISSGLARVGSRNLVWVQGDRNSNSEKLLDVRETGVIQIDSSPLFNNDSGLFTTVNVVGGTDSLTVLGTQVRIRNGVYRIDHGVVGRLECPDCNGIDASPLGIFQDKYYVYTNPLQRWDADHWKVVGETLQRPLYVYKITPNGILAFGFDGRTKSEVQRFDGEHWHFIDSVYAQFGSYADIDEIDGDIWISGQFYKPESTSQVMDTTIFIHSGSEWHALRGLPQYSTCLQIVQVQGAAFISDAANGRPYFTKVIHSQLLPMDSTLHYLATIRSLRAGDSVVYVETPEYLDSTASDSFYYRSFPRRIFASSGLKWVSPFPNDSIGDEYDVAEDGRERYLVADFHSPLGDTIHGVARYDGTFHPLGSGVQFTAYPQQVFVTSDAVWVNGTISSGGRGSFPQSRWKKPKPTQTVRNVNSQSILDRVFPNPASTSAGVMLGDTPNGPVRIELVNAIGQLMQTFEYSSGVQIRIKALDTFPSGQYFLRISDSHSIRTLGLAILH